MSTLAESLFGKPNDSTLISTSDSKPRSDAEISPNFRDASLTSFKASNMLFLAVREALTLLIPSSS